MKLYPTEKQTQTAIINYLRYKGWYVQRLNSGAMRMQAKGKEYLMRLAAPGTPDVVAFKNHAMPVGLTILFVEVKRHGKKPTLAQEQKMEELASFGATCLVADSVDDLEKAGF